MLSERPEQGYRRTVLQSVVAPTVRGPDPLTHPGVRPGALVFGIRVSALRATCATPIVQPSCACLPELSTQRSVLLFVDPMVFPPILLSEK